MPNNITAADPPPEVKQLLTDVLFAPLRAILATTGIIRKCIRLHDLSFAILCVMRCLQNSKTGRDFPQTHAIPQIPDLTRRTTSPPSKAVGGASLNHFKYGAALAQNKTFLRAHGFTEADVRGITNTTDLEEAGTRIQAAFEEAQKRGRTATPDEQERLAQLRRESIEVLQASNEALAQAGMPRVEKETNAFTDETQYVFIDTAAGTRTGYDTEEEAFGAWGDWRAQQSEDAMDTIREAGHAGFIGHATGEGMANEGTNVEVVNKTATPATEQAAAEAAVKVAENDARKAYTPAQERQARTAADAAKGKLANIKARIETFLFDQGIAPADTAGAARALNGVVIKARAFATMLQGRVVGYTVELLNGHQIQDIAEDLSETAMKRAVDEGFADPEIILDDIRRYEAASGARVIPADYTYDPANTLPLVEGFSKLARGVLMGEVRSGLLPPSVSAWIEMQAGMLAASVDLAKDGAAGHWFAQDIQTAGEFRRAREAGHVPPRLERLLKDSLGLDPDAQHRRLERRMEEQLAAEAMDGFPEISEEAKGRLPHPETLRENNHPLYGEVKRLWDSMLKPTKRRTNAGRTVDRTNEANDYFLPAGEMADMDHVREALNERGFAFDTITDMLGALDVSLSYGKPVYGTASVSEGWESWAMGQADMDPDYLAAVKAGDMEKAGKLVGKAWFTQDNLRQAKWLIDKAAQAGYATPDEHAGKNSDEFTALCVEWRDDHPRPRVTDSETSHPDGNPHGMAPGLSIIERDQAGEIIPLARRFPLPESSRGPATYSIGYDGFTLRANGATRYVHSHTGVLFPDGHEIKTTQSAPNDVPAGRGAFWDRLRQTSRRSALLDTWKEGADDPAFTAWLADILDSAPGADARGGSVRSFWNWLLKTLNGYEFGGIGPAMNKIDPLDVMDALSGMGITGAVVSENANPDKRLHYAVIAENSEEQWLEGGSAVLWADEGGTYGFGRLPTGGEVTQAQAAHEKNPELYPTFAMSSAGVLRLDEAIQKRMTRGPDERIEYFGKVRDRLASTVLMLRERKGNMALDMTDAERERNRVRDALAEMTALHKALPADVRGRVLFQPNDVLDQDTERGQVNALIRFVDRIDEAIENQLRKDYFEAFETLLDLAKPDLRQNKQLRGRLTPETQRLVGKALEACVIGPADLAVRINLKQAEIDALEASQPAGPEEIAAAQAALIELYQEQAVLETFGNFSGLDAEGMAKAYEQLQSIYSRGRTTRKIMDEARRAETTAKRDELLSKLPYVDQAKHAARLADKGKPDHLEAWRLGLSSFHQVMETLFPKSQTARDFQAWIRKADRSFTRAKIDAKERYDRFTFAAWNLSGIGANRKRNGILAKLSTLREDWNIQLMEGVGFTGEKLTEDQAAAIVDGTMKTGWETDAIAMTSLRQALADFRMQRLKAQNEDKRFTATVIRFQRLTKRGTPGPYVASDMQALYLLQLHAQEQYRPALDKYGFTADVMAAIERKIDPKALDLGDFLRGEYDAEWDRLNPVYRAIYGMDMPKIRNYAPGLFEHMDAKGVSDGTIDPYGSNAPVNAMSAGFTKARTHHMARPKDTMNAMSGYWAHLEATEYFIAYAEAMREARQVFRHPEVRRRIEGNYGERAANLFTQWLDALEVDGQFRSAEMQAMSENTQKLLATQAAVGLTFNMGVLLKQIPAAFGVLMDMPAKDAFVGIVRAFGNPGSLRAVWNSEAVQQRILQGISPEDRAMLAASNASPSIIMELMDIGRLPIAYADACFTTLSASVSYNHALGEAEKAGLGATQAEAFALAAAARTIERTAQPATAQDKSMAEITAKGFAKFLFMFKSEPRSEGVRKIILISVDGS